MILESDGFVSFVAGVERDQRERDDDVPYVGAAPFHRHRVLEMKGGNQREVMKGGTRNERR